MPIILLLIAFRRHAGSKYVKATCQSAQCDKKLYFCKPCRLKRCYDMGMNMEKFQYNRDSLISSRQTLPRSFGIFVGRSDLVLFCTQSEPTFKDEKKTFIDMKLLLRKASEILEFGPETPTRVWDSKRSHLEKLSIAFQSQTSSSFGKLFEKVSQAEMSKFWEYYVLRVAKWLTYFEEFQKIPHAMKVKLLQTFWHVWGRLDKLAATARSRKLIKADNKRCWAMSNGMIMDLEKTKLDFTWMSDYPLENIYYFLAGIATWDLIPHIDSMEKLEITDMELNYLLAQLAFSYAGKRHQGDILKICERFEEILANDLHNYYVNEMRMPNYSVRMCQLMKINSAIQRDIIVNRPRCELAALFNVFSVEFSHPEMFFDTGLA
uniref:NR LBD domain-containing protein n=1 Tax=Caenorhabditis japonica TaxID=281687 RepID=A0A8R1E1F8_CAEJA